jgi:hypothetical protein
MSRRVAKPPHYAVRRQAFDLARRQVRSVARRTTLSASVPPQLSQPVETSPSGPQRLHEVELDDYPMAACNS